MLKLENIGWTTPDGAKILDGLDLTIPDGCLAVITGPNGSGKTSLARIIAGIEPPTSGRIHLDDTDITHLNITERARLGMSYAFQQPVRFKGITVRQLIDLAAGGSVDHDTLCDTLARVGLCAREYIDREVNSTLSGGEIKRIEIATVLARHSRLSVFDEPEAGIDLWSFTNLINVFSDMRKDLKGTMLIISHQERILKIADVIYVVAGGRIECSGTPEEILPRMMAGDMAALSCYKQEAMFQ